MVRGRKRVLAAYARCYSDLAKLAIFRQDWPLALQMSAGAIRLLAVDHPAVWLYNAIAALQLGEWDTAVKSAQAALQRDDKHEYPVAEYVLGTALDRRGQIDQAPVHYRAFLAASPDADDASRIRQRLTELQAGLRPANR